MNGLDNQRAKMSVQRAERELIALQQDLQRLEAEITHKKDRATKLAHYVEIRREYEREASSTEAGPEQTGESPKPNGSTPRAPKGGASGRAVRECFAILRERKQPVPTRELHEILKQRGIHLGGISPVASLSGYLSRTPGLVADRTLGWSLTEWQS
jgi:hypothetical protein